ncbi:hypothetical protein LPAF129_05030 [Ligilactobacillus pabuli]|uniref:Cell surface protein n=1 Tax=Ligilactobacillus pabuli TaxID=2886039 RepID=A0ABQ5JG33_9LACO|nr:CdaR family protein [Ligilactobacillus pabuli]GKS80818.1 hypothetical protein LPAF129_05030 [Ligilactobacillus pabuli]
MKIAQALNSKVAYSLLALLFTVFLFVYVNSEHSSGDNQSQISTSLMKNTRASVKKEINYSYDSDKYYVDGAQQTAKISLIGPSGLVKAAQNTGNFQLNADLHGLKPGVHTVKLKVSGLSSEISARPTPTEIKVKISKKGHASFPVQVRYDSTRIAKGYATGVASASRQSVKVTGAASDIKKIESVVADVNLPENSKKSTSRNVLLRAIDSAGKELSVTISPEATRVNIPIYLASSDKKVPVHLVSGGQGVAGKKYSFSTDTKYVTLTGTKDALKKIDSLEVPVSLVGVNDNETRTISLDSDRSGITAVSPSSIQVTINVTDEKSAADNSSQGSTNTSPTTGNKETTEEEIPNKNQSEDESQSSESSSSSTESSSSSSANVEAGAE